MAKDKYIVSKTVEVTGMLDYNQNEEMVVYIEQGKGDNIIVIEVPIMDILHGCTGQRIALKLIDEEDRCNE